jgi:hypothetical protein
MGLPVAEPAPAPDPEDWYANLLWFERRKCLLLTHSATLFAAAQHQQRPRLQPSHRAGRQAPGPGC